LVAVSISIQTASGWALAKPAAGDTTRNHVTLVFNFLGELRRLLQ
jgi:hypothetical protein